MVVVLWFAGARLAMQIYCAAARGGTWAENRAVDAMSMLLITGARKGRSAQLADIRACAGAGRADWAATAGYKDAAEASLAASAVEGERRRAGEGRQTTGERRDEVLKLRRTLVQIGNAPACFNQTPVVWTLTREHGRYIDSMRKRGGPACMWTFRFAWSNVVKLLRLRARTPAAGAPPAPAAQGSMFRLQVR